MMLNLFECLYSLFQIAGTKFSLLPVLQSTGDSVARTSITNGGYFSTT